MLKVSQLFRFASISYAKTSLVVSTDVRRQLSSSATKPAWCEKLPRPPYASLERISVPAQPWFEVYRIRPNLFAIYEPYHWEESISYLISGARQSLLIDTGMGIGNIRQVVDSLIPSRTSLRMINTHTHHDHIGDNWRFNGAILGVRSEFAEHNARGSFEEAQNELQPGMVWEKHLPRDFDPSTYEIRPYQINEYVQEGDRIKLDDDRSLQVISTPGHSPDSISLLDEKHRMLFVGDAFYHGPILLYRPETNLHDYRQTLEKLAELSTQVDLILPGHNVPNVSSSVLIRAAEEMRKVMNRQLAGRKTDDGKYLEYSFGEFSFVIDPAFL